VTPMLLKEIFEEQMERKMDSGFLSELSRFNGQLFAAGLTPALKNTQENT